VRRPGDGVAGHENEGAECEQGGPPGWFAVDAVAEIEVAGGAVGVADDGVDEVARDTGLGAAAELEGVDEAVAQLGMAPLDEGGEVVVAAVLQPAPHHQAQDGGGQPAPEEKGQQHPADSGGLPQVVGDDEQSRRRPGAREGFSRIDHRGGSGIGRECPFWCETCRPCRQGQAGI
jgi:hypothetical protein